MTIYDRALDYIRDGDVLGLGTGRAASAFIEALGRRVGQGLRVRGVPTSQASADLAARLGIPLIALDEGMPLAVTFDGADEVDPALNLIKGYGRAMVREKVVAAASNRLVILVGREKLVPALGSPASSRWRWCRSPWPSSVADWPSWAWTRWSTRSTAGPPIPRTPT